MPETGSHMRKPRVLVEYNCFVSANLRADRKGFPPDCEQQLERMSDTLERDPAVLGSVCGARSKHGATRSGYDATFNVVASGIMAASVTASCAFRNALDRLGLEEIDIAHVEITRARRAPGWLRERTRAVAV